MYNYLATDIFQNGKRFINLPKNTLYFFKSETWWCYIGSKFTLVLLKIYFLYDVRLEINEFPLSAMVMLMSIKIWLIYT